MTNPFTDKDLKFFKEYMSEPECINTRTGSAILRLIARLEAAERLSEWVMTWESHENCNSKGCECGLQKDIKAWRKAAGK